MYVEVKQMKLRDLQHHVYEKVYVYTSKDGEWIEFEDVYKGKFEDIPDKLLECEVSVIGARRKGCLDIGIKYVTSIN